LHVALSSPLNRVRSFPVPDHSSGSFSLDILHRVAIRRALVAPVNVRRLRSCQGCYPDTRHGVVFQEVGMPRAFDLNLERSWRERLQEFERCGLSVREYCRSQAIHEHTFFWWRRELAKRDRLRKGAAPPNFVSRRPLANPRRLLARGERHAQVRRLLDSFRLPRR
jgi:hypothetical protein